MALADDGAFSVCAVVGGQDVAIAITLYVGTGFTASQYQVLGFYYGMSEWMLMQIVVVRAARRRFMQNCRAHVRRLREPRWQRLWL